MSAFGSNSQIGNVPSGPNAQPFIAPEYATTSNGGPTTHGGNILDALGLGGPLLNPQQFAGTENPTGGKMSGTNLVPADTSVKGANDIARLDPRTWFPGVMTLFHSTRKPGGPTSQ